MNLLHINPLKDLNLWLNTENHLLKNNETVANNEWTPRVDIIEDEKKFIIHAELAGVAKNDIKIHVDNNILTLSGERKATIKNEKQHQIERFYGRFSRNFSLPKNIDADNIKAENENGILSLTLPKKALNHQFKKIEIH